MLVLFAAVTLFFLSFFRPTVFFQRPASRRQQRGTRQQPSLCWRLWNSWRPLISSSDGFLQKFCLGTSTPRQLMRIGHIMHAGQVQEYGCNPVMKDIVAWMGRSWLRQKLEGGRKLQQKLVSKSFEVTLACSYAID